jgi:hypothetical protein
MQPVVIDEYGVTRFKKNAIVRWLLDTGGKNLNQIALQHFPREDEEQFAQLIGYSVAGACDLSYMSDRVCNAALAESEALARRKRRATQRGSRP